MSSIMEGRSVDPQHGTEMRACHVRARDGFALLYSLRRGAGLVRYNAHEDEWQCLECFQTTTGGGGRPAAGPKGMFEVFGA